MTMSTGDIINGTRSRSRSQGHVTR